MFRWTVAALALVAGAAQAQLAARDLNGDGLTDAYFDSAQNITWLADASAGGYLTRSDAMTWVASLQVGSVTGWRLPNSFVADVRTCPDSPSPWCGGRLENEMSRLFQNLGGAAPFVNVIGQPYVTGDTFYLTAGSDAQFFSYFNPASGGIGYSSQFTGTPGGVWAVHDGDVGSIASASPVPEPSTVALMALGLLLLLHHRPRGTAVHEPA